MLGLCLIVDLRWVYGMAIWAIIAMIKWCDCCRAWMRAGRGIGIKLVVEWGSQVVCSLVCGLQQLEGDGGL